ncbi:MAG: tetratricopeptide repeat protein [Alphaproteobacteria bacterium]|nr:tetratricopeptide repeat protein [Alphaproteobacteria bacterium]MDE2492915.1 tetratricopeptide repeat protein [Alphaproteobacteria bacterium]
MKLLFRLIVGGLAAIAVLAIALFLFFRFGPYHETYLCEHRTGQAQVDACTKVVAAANGSKLDWAYIDRGNGYIALREFGYAIDDLTKAISMNPNSAPAHLDRGVAEVQIGESDAAMKDFDAAVRLKPDFALALRDRGMSYSRMGQMKRALKDLDAALRIKPDDPLALLNRGVAYVALHRDADAIRDYTEALPLTHNSPPTFALRGAAYFDMKQYARALHDIEQSLRGEPTPAGFNMLCWTHAVMGQQLDAALAACNRALAIAPDPALRVHEAALDSRAFVYFRMGKYKETLADTAAVLAITPKQATSLYVQGLAELRLGDAAKGNGDIAAAEKLDPKIAATYAGYGVKP